jgi:hypothetical protein
MPSFGAARSRASRAGDPRARQLEARESNSTQFCALADQANGREKASFSAIFGSMITLKKEARLAYHTTSAWTSY